MKPSILTLGVDLKFTEEGRPVVIEVNGSNSGAEGLASLLSHSLEDQRRRAIAAAGFEEYDVPHIDERPLGDTDLYWSYDRLNVKEVEEAMKLPIIDTTAGLTLRERMLSSFFQFREDNDEETLQEKQKIMKNIKRGIQDWAERNPRNAKMIQWVKDASSKIKIDIASSELAPLSVLWGVSRYGYVDGIGLVFDIPEEVQKSIVFPQLKPLLPGIMDCIYKYFPVMQKRLIAVHPHDADKLWVHPSHVFATRRLSDGEAAHRPPRNSFPLENIVDDKWKQKEIIPQKYQVPSMLWDGDFGKLEEFLYELQHSDHALINPATAPYVVLKNRRFSSGGRGVLMTRINDKDAIHTAIHEASPGFVVAEGFAPSRPVRNRRTKEYHDSCMRFRIDCLVNGTVTRVHEAVYNRLSPVPLGESENLRDMHIINRSGHLKAIPQIAGQTEITQARKVVWDIINRLVSNPKLFEAPQTCQVYS